MLVHFFNRQSWSEMNENLEAVLGLNTQTTSARLYRGFHHGLMEIVMGLARQFPFKKKIYFWKSIDPFFEPVITALSREGYRVQGLSSDEIQSPQSWIDQIDKETLLVLFPEDDPLLGRLHSIESLERALEDKRVFSIKASHHAFKYRAWPKELKRFAIELWSIDQSTSLALLGDRARFGDWMSEGISWEPETIEKVCRLRPPRQLNSQKILNFEKALPEGFQPVFADDQRLFDRSVFYSEDMDGLAVIEELAKSKKLRLLSPGEETRFETTSLGRWGGLKTMDWLNSYGLKSSQIRGLVILSDDVINEKLAIELSMIRSQLLSRQNGN